MTNFSKLASHPWDNVDFLSQKLTGDTLLVSGGPTEYQPEASTQFGDPEFTSTFQGLPEDINSIDTPHPGYGEALIVDEKLDVTECSSGGEGNAFKGNVGHNLGEPNEKVATVMMEILGNLRLRLDELDKQIRQLEELKAQREKVSESIVGWEGILSQVRARI